MKKQPIWWNSFLNEYLKNGGNGTQAYLKARPGVKANSAAMASERLMRNDDFKAFFGKAQSKVTAKIEMSREEWFRGLAEIAKFNLSDYFEDTGDDLNLKNGWQKKEDRHVIESIESKTTTSQEGQVFRTMKFKAASKLAAYQLLGKALGFLDEKVEHKHTGQIDHNLKLNEENIDHLNELRKRFPMPNMGFTD